VGGSYEKAITFSDWIITGVAGEMYPCKPGIFDATYDKVNGSDD